MNARFACIDVIMLHVKQRGIGHVMINLWLFDDQYGIEGVQNKRKKNYKHSQLKRPYRKIHGFDDVEFPSKIPQVLEPWQRNFT